MLSRRAFLRLSSPGFSFSLAVRQGLLPTLARTAFALLALCLVCVTPVHAADVSAMPIAGLMRLLPTSIFDNTDDPISQDALDLLLTRGYTENWIVVENTRDSLRLVAAGDSPGEIQALVLRSDSRGLIILSARADDSCATELWTYNARGGLVPYADPPDPATEEYFDPAKKLPRGLFSSCHMCLEADMLEAVPQFWNAAGPTKLSPDKRIFYLWTGEEFVKKVSPASDVRPLPVSPALPAPVSPTPEKGKDKP